MPIHTELKADFNGVQNPYPLTPSDALVSSIINSANQNREVDWSNDLSSWNGDTGELSVVQRQIPTQNGTMTVDFIKGYPASAPIDGTDTGVIYDTNDAVNFDFTSSSDNPSFQCVIQKEQLLQSQEIIFEVESNRTNPFGNYETSDRLIQVRIVLGGLSPEVELNVKNGDSGDKSDSVSLPKGFFDNAEFPSSGTIGISFDNSNSGTVAVSVSNSGSNNPIGSVSVDVSTNGLPSNPNTLVGYSATGINNQQIS